MAGDDNDHAEKSLEATPRKLAEARERGDTPMVRESAAAAGYLAALVAVLLVGGAIARHIGEILLPMIDQPEAFLSMDAAGFQRAGQAVGIAVAIALAPFFGLTLAGALLPYVMQNAVVVSVERITPKLSHLSPRSGFKRMFSVRSLVEFAKGLVKMIAVGVTCYLVSRPLYRDSVGWVALDLSSLPSLLLKSVLTLLAAVTVVAVVIAGADVPYQHLMWRHKMRMTLQEMRDELKHNEGDPHIKMKRRSIARQRAQRRMMHDVPKATVIITNPTHFAVALRYQRGQDAAPVVVAKGVDLIAHRIRDLGREHGVAVVENPPLARALHASVEIGDAIPSEHFEAVAKIIGLIWARRGRPPVLLPKHAVPPPDIPPMEDATS